MRGLREDDVEILGLEMLHIGWLRVATVTIHQATVNLVSYGLQSGKSKGVVKLVSGWSPSLA